MSRWFEYWYPRLGGIVTVVLYVAILGKSPLQPALKDVFTAALTLAAITVGFLITAASTLLTIQESNVIMRRARRAGAYQDLVEYVISAARWNFCTAVASALALLMDLTHPREWQAYTFAMWLGIAVIAALTITRIFKLLTSILRLNADPNL